MDQNQNFLFYMSFVFFQQPALRARLGCASFVVVGRRRRSGGFHLCGRELLLLVHFLCLLYRADRETPREALAQRRRYLARWR